MLKRNHMKIAVVGLGYVGLPLAVEFGKKYPTVGIDLSAEKVAAYRNFVGPAGEASSEGLRAATQLSCHTDSEVLQDPTNRMARCARSWMCRIRNLGYGRQKSIYAEA